MIEVIGLTKNYGDKRGVSNINFEIKKGEIVGLLGPNGAGKSTIMKMIAGYMSPSGGDVIVDGISVIENPKEVCKKIGFLSEIPPLYTEMDVFEYLNFVCEIRGIKKKERKKHIEEIMELTQIVLVKERLICNLSKGYRQRVGLAQALIGLPEILIFDEPTVGLDPKQITEVRNLIKMLSQSHTVILSSHILSEISMICEKIIIINNGEVITIDTVENLSRDVGGKGDFVVKVVGSKKDVYEKILTLEGVIEVLENTSLNEENCSFTVRTDKVTEVKIPLFRLLAKEDMPIVELKSVAGNLEEVFLKLTDEEYRTQVEEE